MDVMPLTFLRVISTLVLLIGGGRGARLGAALSAEGLLLPSRLGGPGERRKLPSGVRGGASAANDFGTLWAYKTTLVALKYYIQVANFCVFT